jgi:hypothetical protein
MLQRARNAALMQLAAGELKYFANANLAGNPGNMSVFNTAWNEMGDKEVRGASRMPSSTHAHSLMILDVLPHDVLEHQRMHRFLLRLVRHDEGTNKAGRHTSGTVPRSAGRGLIFEADRGPRVSLREARQQVPTSCVMRLWRCGWRLERIRRRFRGGLATPRWRSHSNDHLYEEAEDETPGQ